MDSTTHIKTSKRTYYGAIILSILAFLFETYRTDKSLSAIASSTIGIIAFIVISYSFYKIFYSKGKIILTESEFKVQGHSWTNWGDLSSIYHRVEEDSENGPQCYICFRLNDGTDQSVSSVHLELDFPEIAELVNQYKTNYINTKKENGT